MAGPDAHNVSFNETLAGMTQTGGVHVTPIAFNDSGYTLVGNTPITFSGVQSVLANDIDPNGPTPLSNVGLTAINLVTDANTHGNVVLNPDGSFTYTPTTGYAGVATFQYTAHDAEGLNSDVTATVTLTVTDPVWYVDSAAAGGGDGSFGNAFHTVQAAVNAAAANGNDANGEVNDTIFVTNQRRHLHLDRTGITLANAARNCSATARA